MSEVKTFEELRSYLKKIHPQFSKMCQIMNGKEEKLVDQLLCSINKIEITFLPDVEAKALRFEINKKVTPVELEGLFDTWLPLEVLRKAKLK